MSKNKIIDYFLKQAETGNWDKIKYSDVEKRLNFCIEKNLWRNILTKYRQYQYFCCAVVVK